MSQPSRRNEQPAAEVQQEQVHQRYKDNLGVGIEQILVDLETIPKRRSEGSFLFLHDVQLRQWGHYLEDFGLVDG